MFRQNPVPLMSIALLATIGCTSRETDSLTREKASMESEAKAMAQHKTPPVATPARPGPAAAGSAKSTETGARLPAGTPVRIVTAQSLSTRSATTGQDWLGELTEDLKDSAGKVLAKAGSEVKGRVVLASDGSNLRRKHELEVRIYRIQALSGPVDVRTTSFVQEGADGGSKPAIIGSGAKIDFQLASAVVFPSN